MERSSATTARRIHAGGLPSPSPESWWCRERKSDPVRGKRLQTLRLPRSPHGSGHDLPARLPPQQPSEPDPGEEGGQVSTGGAGQERRQQAIEPCQVRPARLPAGRAEVKTATNVEKERNLPGVVPHVCADGAPEQPAFRWPELCQ